MKQSILDTLARHQQSISSDFEAIKQGSFCQRIRRSDTQKENYIRQQKELLEARKLTPWEFLDRMATTIDFKNSKWLNLYMYWSGKMQ